MIGKNIKSLRKTYGLTQPEFARIITFRKSKCTIFGALLTIFPKSL